MSFLDVEVKVNLQGTSDPPASLQCYRFPVTVVFIIPLFLIKKPKHVRLLAQQMTTEQLFCLSKVYKGLLLEEECLSENIRYVISWVLYILFRIVTE